MFGLPVKPRKPITMDRMRPYPIDPPGVRLDCGHVSISDNEVLISLADSLC